MYINGQNVDLKDIRLKIKKGRTAGDIASDYGISEEEFLEKLRERVGQRYQSYYRDLEKNKSLDRKMKRKMCSTKSMPYNFISEDEKMENRENIIMSEEFQNSEMSEEGITREAELEISIEWCEAEIRELSEAYDQTEREKENNALKISKTQETLNECKRAIIVLENELEELEKLDATYDERLNKLTYDIESKEEELRSAQEELEICRKIIIRFNDGKIEISKEGYEARAEEIKEKCSELVDSEKFDDFTFKGKQLKIVSEVLCVIEAIQIMEENYILEYDTFEDVIKSMLEIAVQN